MNLRKEIEKRAHDIEAQGDGVEMVLIRMDEILAAVRAAKRKKKPISKKRKK
jgi:hypothetical protein